MTEATEAQRRAEELINALWHDSEVGKKIQTLAKSKWSDVKTADELVAPYLDPVMARAKSLEEELKTMREERAAEKEAAKEAASRKKLEDSIEAARAAYNLTEEGFNQMIDRMKTTGNYTDAEAAAAYVASKAPPAKVAGPTWGPQNLNLFGSNQADEKMAHLHRDPQGYMDSELTAFVNDPDAYVRDTLGRAA